MKKLHLIGLTLFLSCHCPYLFAMPHDSIQTLRVDVEIISLDESIPFRFPKFQGEEYFIVITLANLQDTTVTITTMACSWNESFIFDSDSLSLTNPGCDSNIPVEIQIEAHKSVRFYAKLRSQKIESNYQNPFTFKIGFLDLNWEQLIGALRTPSSKKLYKTYWSDSVYLSSSLYGYKNNSEQVP